MQISQIWALASPRDNVYFAKFPLAACADLGKLANIMHIIHVVLLIS